MTNKKPTVMLGPYVLLTLIFLLCSCGSDSGSTSDDEDSPIDTNDSESLDSDSGDDTSYGTDDSTDNEDSDTTVPLDDSVTLEPPTLTFDTPNQSQTLVATVKDDDTNAVVWESSDPYIATVNAFGSVTARSGGTVTITATSVADNTKSATCEVTIIDPDREIAEEFTDATSIASGPVNIIMCGDSTMATYTASASDQAGWGQVLTEFLSDDVIVNNELSAGGRSSRSFFNEEGKWDAAKELLAAATTPTFVFIQFSHNDEKKVTDTEGADRLTFARNNQNGTVAGTYYDYLERYIVETRELGGIPVLFTPFVRAYLSGGEVTIKGQHNITEIYDGETAARGDYPTTMKEIAAKHNVPVIDLTAASKVFVEAHAASDVLDYIYIAGDQTHERNLGALLLAQAATEGLATAGILNNYIQVPDARLMIDTNSLAMGSLYTGTNKETSFMMSAYKDIAGTIDIAAPDGYTLSLDGTTYESTLSIACDDTWVGATVNVRFAPEAVGTYHGELTIAHTSITPDYGNSPPNDTPGTISITGIGKEAVDGDPATATWPLVDTTADAFAAVATMEGAVSAGDATLVGLTAKDVSNGARLTTLDGSWTADAARNEERYIEFTISTTASSFNLDEIAMYIGTGGGSKMQWDVVYSTADDFSEPVELLKTGTGTKDVLDFLSFPGIGLPVDAGTTLYVRVYPYNPDVATGKYVLLENFSISGVTN